jgi:predicted O-methyltransferase YrrM
MTMLETIAVADVHRALMFDAPIVLPPAWRNTPLTEWKMVADGHLLRQIFRAFRPMRHLEFGTWLGDSVLRCVEECDATVWTINLLEGETGSGGGWAYGEPARPEWESARGWSQREGPADNVGVRTDAYGMIGFNYLKAGWGKRVCQIYADSREWDTRAYPDGFFDTALIDGGHTADVVESDTRNSLRLVRSGGLIMWHDFCPDDAVRRECGSTRDVHQFITSHVADLAPSLKRLFWIEPSWLLVGIRA